LTDFDDPDLFPIVGEIIDLSIPWAAINLFKSISFSIPNNW
jgi:hypothetical protein